MDYGKGFAPEYKSPVTKFTSLVQLTSFVASLFDKGHSVLIYNLAHAPYGVMVWLFEEH